MRIDTLKFKQNDLIMGQITSISQTFATNTSRRSPIKKKTKNSLSANTRRDKNNFFAATSNNCKQEDKDRCAPRLGKHKKNISLDLNQVNFSTKKKYNINVNSVDATNPNRKDSGESTVYDSVCSSKHKTSSLNNSISLPSSIFSQFRPVFYPFNKQANKDSVVEKFKLNSYSSENNSILEDMLKYNKTNSVKFRTFDKNECQISYSTILNKIHLSNSVFNLQPKMHLAHKINGKIFMKKKDTNVCLVNQPIHTGPDDTTAETKKVRNSF